MTKAEFDYGYSHQEIAVHLPSTEEAQYLVNYVNQLCCSTDKIDWDINQFPYLFYLGDHRHTGWTGNGTYDIRYTKISYDEFFAAVNDCAEIIDVELESLTEII